MKKCKKCGAPLEGFLYNTIGKLLGLKPSANDPELCNKCEGETEAKSEMKESEEKETATPEVNTEAEPEKMDMPEEKTAEPEVEKPESAEAEAEKKEEDDLIS